MKTLKMENHLIGVVFEFLRTIDLSTSRIASRGRSKILKRLEEKSKELKENQNTIRKEYFELDENGEFKVDENGQNLIYLDTVTEADKKVLDEEILELNKETFEITFTEYSNQYEALFKALNDEEIDLGVELSGNNALAYNELMDAYEANENNKEEK